MSGALIALVAITVAIIIGCIIGKKLENKYRARAEIKVIDYENGIKIKWDNGNLRECYAKRYNIDIEPVENDILKMFKELNVPITDYNESYFTIPWRYIKKWKHITSTKGNLPAEHIVFMLVDESIALSIFLSAAYHIDPTYMAFKKYASEKEILPTKAEENAVIYVIVFLLIIYFIIGIKGILLKNL